MFEKNLLAGKTVLVTGGGTGLGAAMAARFASLGANLVLAGRRVEVLEATAANLRTPTTRVDVRVIDVRSPDSVAEGIQAIWDKSEPDVLVNNAGANFIAQTEHLSLRAADAVLATSLHGSLYCTMEMGRRWIANGKPGVVLSIMSTSVVTGRAFTVPSAIAKTGLLAMTKSLAVEWGPKNVRLVGIAPGPFPTAGASRQLHPGDRSELVARAPFNPLGRVGQTDELTDLASYLISDRAGYINGEVVVLDGGAHLRTSGAEDLLQWPTEKWAAMRASRPAASPAAGSADTGA